MNDDATPSPDVHLEGLPILPTSLTRWSVDRHYTALVDHLRGDGSPAAVADAAKKTLLGQFKAAFPSHSVPEYIANLGIDPAAELMEGDSP